MWTTPPGRPIVSSIRAPTERISALVDLTLQPLVKSLPSYVKDTKDFLVQLASLPQLPAGAILFTMDVVGLYNNIPHKDGLQACSTMLDRRHTQSPPTSDIIDLANLVLTLNAFKHNNDFYLQVHGTAMGTRMAPSFANIFMGCLEETFLSTAPEGNAPAFYKRFIDDVFGIWLHGKESLLRFIRHANNAHPDIIFTFEYGLSVPFLDTRVTIDNGRIITDLHCKPTDTHQYLLPSSNHPPHIHKNLPYGLGLRLRAIVSEEENLNMRLEELSRFLVLRGYSPAVINEQFVKVRAKSRMEVLSIRRQQANNNRIPLVCTWSRFLPPFDILAKNAMPILHTNGRLQQLFNLPIISYRRPSNLRDLLVKTRPSATNEVDTPGTHPCKSPRCKTCAIIDTATEIAVAPNSKHIIRDHFDCKTSNIVYLIRCTNCNAAYVGETGCPLRDRMNQHRSTIRNNSDTPVSHHFRNGHDLKVLAIQHAPADTLQRRILERQWIERLQREDCLLHLINRDGGIEILTLT